MRHLLSLLLGLSLFTGNQLFAQWIQTDGPYGYMQVLDVKQHNSILFAGTVCGLFAKPANSQEWQRISYNLTPRLFLKGDSLFTSFYHSLGVIDLNDPKLEEHQKPYSGNPFINGPSLAFNDSLMFVTSKEGIFVSNDLGDSVYQYLQGLDVDTMTYSGGTYYSLWSTDVITTSEYVFCSTEKGIYRSDFSLGGWDQKSNGIHGALIRQLYVANNDLYALSHDSLYISTDNGESWDAILGSEARLLDFSLYNNSFYVAADSVGILNSGNGGQLWDTLNTGIENKGVSGVETAQNELYSMVSGEGIYKWDGNKWEKEPTSGMFCTRLTGIGSTGSEVYTSDLSGFYRLKPDDSFADIPPDPPGNRGYGNLITIGDTLLLPAYYYSNSGMTDSIRFLYSDDEDASWSSMPAPFSPSWGVPQIELRYLDGDLYAFNDYVIYHSANWGQTWSDITPTGMTCFGINDLIYFDGHLYAAMCSKSSLLVREKNSNSWVSESVGTTGGSEMNHLMVRDTAIFVQAFDQIFRKYKGEVIWQRTNSGWPPNHANAFINVGENLFVASAAGVFRTDDFGGNWQEFNDSLPVRVRPVDIAVYDDSLYLATTEHGVFKHALPEEPMASAETPHNEQWANLLPNPAQDHFRIQLHHGGSANLELRDMTGKVVLKRAVDSEERIAVENLPNGVYIAIIRKGKARWHQKLLIE